MVTSEIRGMTYKKYMVVMVMESEMQRVKRYLNLLLLMISLSVTPYLRRGSHESYVLLRRKQYPD